jgi:hypothetical protein
MAQRGEPTAAQALFPNLPQGTPEPVEQRHKPSTAQAMWPALATTQPRRLSPNELKQAWIDHLLALSGLRRRE